MAQSSDYNRLRFSFVLQIVAGVLLLVAGLIRGFSLGWDFLTILLLLLAGFNVVLARFTRAKLQEL